MIEHDPILRNAVNSGKKPIIVRESEWIREYEIGEHELYYQSKLVTDGLAINAEDLIRRWPNMDQNSRFDLIQALHAKYEFSANEEHFIEYLMDAAGDPIWTMMATLVCRLSNRRAAVAFLTSRLSSETEPSANYFQAAELIQSSELIPLLRHHFEISKTRGGTTATEEVVRSSRVSKRAVAHLRLCNALWKITREPEYRNEVLAGLRHPEAVVRNCARRCVEDDSRNPQT